MSVFFPFDVRLMPLTRLNPSLAGLPSTASSAPTSKESFEKPSLFMRFGLGHSTRGSHGAVRAGNVEVDEEVRINPFHPADFSAHMNRLLQVESRASVMRKDRRDQQQQNCNASSHCLALIA